MLQVARDSTEAIELAPLNLCQDRISGTLINRKHVSCIVCLKNSISHGTAPYAPLGMMVSPGIGTEVSFLVINCNIRRCFVHSGIPFWEIAHFCHCTYFFIGSST